VSVAGPLPSKSPSWLPVTGGPLRGGELLLLPGAAPWQEEMHAGRFEALLHDAPGRGRHSVLDPATLIDRLRQASLLLADGHLLSLRRAAAFLEVSPSTVWRALRKVDEATSPGSVPPTVGAKQ